MLVEFWPRSLEDASRPMRDGEHFDLLRVDVVHGDGVSLFLIFMGHYAFF